MIESATHREDLIDEIERYLAVVDVFRALGSEPAWRAESEPGALRIEDVRQDEQLASAH
jgi:hypothetical protein